MRVETNYDWNYPFDFCGSFYRHSHVLQIYNLVVANYPAKVLRPNHFEFYGNVVIKSTGLLEKFPECVCLSRPVMTVVTVNKVQEIYDTPVFDSEDNILILMNQYMKDGKTYDL